MGLKEQIEKLNPYLRDSSYIKQNACRFEIFDQRPKRAKYIFLNCTCFVARKQPVNGLFTGCFGLISFLLRQYGMA